MADFGIRLGVRTTGSKRAYTLADDTTIKEMYEAGAKIGEIAKAIGRSSFSVQYRVRSLQGKTGSAEAAE